MSASEAGSAVQLQGQQAFTQCNMDGSSPLVLHSNPLQERAKSVWMDLLPDQASPTCYCCKAVVHTAQDSGKGLSLNAKHEAACASVMGCVGTSLLWPSSRVSQELLPGLQCNWINTEASHTVDVHPSAKATVGDINISVRIKSNPLSLMTFYGQWLYNVCIWVINLGHHCSTRRWRCVLKYDLSSS